MRLSRIQTVCLFLFTILVISGIARPQVAESLTSYIDEHNRFILNGEPFFPLGLYVAQCSTVDQSVQLGEIENSPFNTLMNYNINRCGNDDAEDDDINYYLNQLESRNLKLIFCLVKVGEGNLNGRPLDIGAIEYKVETFQNRSAIISWYINDEVDLQYLSELEGAYIKIRQLDQNHPVWSVHWDTVSLVEEAHTTEIVGVDPSPIGNQPITQVSHMADEANEAGKPLWLVPQIFDWADHNYGEGSDNRAFTGWPPTWEEMRAMTYLATNHGAKGLIYYSYFNIFDDLDYATRWYEIKEIASEIDQLRSVFLSTYQTGDNDISCNNDNIDFQLMWNDSKYYLFAVNTKAPCEIIIDNDNPEATYVGNWPFHSGDYYAYGFDFQDNTPGVGGDTATWTPNITKAGYYRVYARWTADTDRATNAPYTIYYDGGSEAITVNQQANGGRWYLLGTYPFAAGTSSSVVLNDGADGVVIADAIRWQLKEGDVTSVSFQINLARKPAVFDTMFEDGRQISVVNEKVTDDFDAYEVHVYRWEGHFEGASTGGSDGSSGGTCFIATAAFGSYVDPHVQVVKDFRDEYLLRNMPGRWFVGMYNTYGPFWADQLNAHPRYKPFVRLALMPVVGISYFVLNTSLTMKLLTGFLLMGFVVICVLRIHGSSK